MLYKAKLNMEAIDQKVDVLARHNGLIHPLAGQPFLDNATNPIKNHSTPGYRGCLDFKVWLVEVGRNAWPRTDNEEYDVKVSYGVLEGSWGRTRSYAFVKYAFADEARTSVRTMGISYAADIRLKPKSEFVSIDEFAPFYARIKSEFGGDVDRFARHLAMDTTDAYRKFGVLKSVLFHEYLHFRLAQIDGKLRHADLKAKVGKLGYAADADAAVDRLQGVVEETFQDWSGEITYKPSNNNHVFIWEEEVKYLVRRYEKEVLGK